LKTKVQNKPWRGNSPHHYPLLLGLLEFVKLKLKVNLSEKASLPFGIRNKT